MLQAMFRRFAVAATLTLLAPSAFAQQEPTQPPTQPPDVVKAPDTNPSKDVSRPWLYNDDPTIPAPLHVVASLTNSYSGDTCATGVDCDRSVTRAFASSGAGAGAKLAAGAQIGLVHMLAVDLDGVAAGFGSDVRGGFYGGLRFAPFDGAKHGFRLAIASGYLLDLDQASGFYARIAASYDVGRLRLAAYVHGEHVWRAGSDPVDLSAAAGASVRIVPAFRLGLEYVVQDIEEAFAKDDDDDDDDVGPGRAEGGVHQFLGLTGTFELLHHRLFLDVGPALAFRPEIGQVAPVARALVSYTF